MLENAADAYGGRNCVSKPETASAVVTSRELAIARSVIFASVFDYPLTLEQLHRALLESEQTAAEVLAVYDGSELLQAIVEYRDGFFFPIGRADLIAERRRREARSRAFLLRHRRLLRLLCALPFTRLVALSGSIARLNLEKDGTLDVFIITRGRRTATVRVLALLLTTMLRQRRIRASSVIADTSLALDAQDLFTASQILHLSPLVGDGVLDQLLAANPFVARLFPNATARQANTVVPAGSRMLAGAKALIEAVLRLPAPLIEAACRPLLPREPLERQATCDRQAILARFDAAVTRALDHGLLSTRPSAMPGRAD
jgi:hypothetical protein